MAELVVVQSAAVRGSQSVTHLYIFVESGASGSTAPSIGPDPELQSKRQRCPRLTSKPLTQVAKWASSCLFVVLICEGHSCGATFQYESMNFVSPPVPDDVSGKGAHVVSMTQLSAASRTREKLTEWPLHCPHSAGMSWQGNQSGNTDTENLNMFFFLLVLPKFFTVQK